ncbi:hypothetical protein NL676_004212 [Syzygium grande]|nr:hypothetical protein NL676_004212 [Syzygium grande]
MGTTDWKVAPSLIREQWRRRAEINSGRRCQVECGKRRRPRLVESYNLRTAGVETTRSCGSMQQRQNRNKNSSSTTRKNRQGLELYSYFVVGRTAARLVLVGAADVGKQRRVAFERHGAATAAASLRRRGHKSGHKGREFGHEGLGRAHALFSQFSLYIFRT